MVLKAGTDGPYQSILASVLQYSHRCIAVFCLPYWQYGLGVDAPVLGIYSCSKDSLWLKIWFCSRKVLFLQSLRNKTWNDDSILYSTATPPAMAQKHLCFCPDLLQQQSVERGFLLADVGRICLFLSDIQFDILFQRPAGCGGRPPSS